MIGLKIIVLRKKGITRVKMRDGGKKWKGRVRGEEGRC
jgi:hypothetical protein